MASGKHNSYKDILKAQKWLRNLGSKITLNGRYTIGMVTAICCFQRKYDIPQTGELDDLTWKRLKKENSWLKKIFK